MSKNLLDYVGLGYFLEKIKTLFVTELGTSGDNLTWTKNSETNNIAIPYATEASKIRPIQTKTYENVLRNGTGYTSPYTNSYLYFGSVKTTNLALPSHVKYRVLAYAPSNANFLLESIVEWYFGKDGIYKGSYIWNNLSSTSYYPFYCHTLYSAKTAAIATSDGSYLGCYYGTSTSYGQSPNTVARTIKIDILECNNCTVSLLDNVVWLVNTDNVPANLKLPSTSKAYNDTNFTANNVVTTIGLQEFGDANTNTIAYLVRTNSYSKPMKAVLGYGYRLLFTSADLLGWIPATTSTSSNATDARTPCTEPIDPFGEIVYYAGSGAVAVDGRPSTTSLWQQYTLTFGYSFNTTGAALTLTSWKPVYIKCTPQSNGSAILEGYTLDLPTTEDGFIYIYLGVAYSATAIELIFNHPVYYYKNGAVRLWTNEQDSAFTTSPSASITSANITSWNNKVDKVTSTDNAVVRFDGTSGAIQNSGVTINDSNHVTAAKFVTSGGTSNLMVCGNGSLSVNYFKNGSVATPASAMGNLGNFYTSQLNNAFYALHKRKTITQTGFASFSAGELFDNRYDVGTCKINAGGTGVITIGATTDSIFTTYTYGSIYVSFYTESTKGTAQSVSIRAYGTQNGTVGWYDYPTATHPVDMEGNGVSNCFKSSQTTIYNIKVWEITIVAHSTLPTYVSEIFAIFTRTNGEVDQSVVTKYANAQNLYGDITAPKFITRGATSSQFVKGDGSLDSNEYVALGTAQTILGLKTFTNGLKLNTATSWTNSDRAIPFSASGDSTTIQYINDNTTTGLTYNPSTGALKAGSFVKRGGASSQFLKADGSVDSTSYGTYSKPSGGIPKTDLASAVQTSLGKADTALQSFTETDPTVPSWAKASTKPTYTAQEVGALPSTTSIPSKTSDLTNDSGFVTTSDISGVYKYKGTKTNYSNLPTSGNVTGDVWNVTNANGNIPAGTNYAWNGSAWDALGGSVDLSGYVPTSRTINGKPLSANVTLSASDVSALPSSTTIPTALADLTADSTHRLVTDTEKSTWNGKYSKPSGGIPKTDLASAILTSLGKADTALLSESDPVFSASAAAGITSSDITNWNGKTSNTGTITSVVTTAGAHTTINKTSGSAAFNVPTKTSHLTNDSGFLTAHLSIKTVNGNTLVGTGNVTIPTPNDATLTIKRDGATLGTFTADSSQNKDIELRVLQSKTFTGVIGTANDLPGATFYFMSVLPEDRVKPCTVKYRIYASMEGLAEGIEESIVTMTFSKNTVLSYDVWNYIANTSYRPYYYHYRYLSTLAGHNSGYGHLVGVGMRYSYNPATAANARTYVIDILDVRGGTVTFFDTMLKFANVPGTGATNYSGESTYDATTNGETHQGDRNDVNYQNREYYGCRKTNSALYRYMLCLTKSDSSLVPLNSVNNSIATNKTLTTDSFDPFGEILFWNTTTTYAAGANVGDGWYRLYLCDIRYSFNCGGYNTTSTLVGRLPLYLVAVPQSDGTAVLHSEPLSLTLPNTENGLIYIYLGTIYPDNYPYRLNLALVHPIYYYKDLAVRLWTGRSYVSLETDPVFSASAAANITSSNITDWNNKESTSNKVTSISASSTDTLYPSAKCVYETILNSLQRDYVFIEGEDIYADFTPISGNFSFILGASNYNDF